MAGYEAMQARALQDYAEAAAAASSGLQRRNTERAESREKVRTLCAARAHVSPLYALPRWRRAAWLHVTCTFIAEHGIQLPCHPFS